MEKYNYMIFVGTIDNLISRYCPKDMDNEVINRVITLSVVNWVKESVSNRCIRDGYFENFIEAEDPFMAIEEILDLNPDDFNRYINNGKAITIIITSNHMVYCPNFKVLMVKTIYPN